MALRADIQWRDDQRLAGCMSIGHDGHSRARHDDYCKACTVFAWWDGVAKIEVLGWTGNITTEHWRAMEACFFREGAREYLFERWEGGKLVHRCHKRWNIPHARWKRVNEAA